MKKFYTFFYVLLIATASFAQETIVLAGYDGVGLSVTATSNVNQSITIVFEDANIIDNFYTQFQDNIWMYGGLDTDSGAFQGAPSDFGDLSQQPQFMLIDADNNAAPNSYSITINLAQYYSGVADGTMVYGLNLLFQNQFGGGGNNQTTDLYIDLVDAIKDSTLGIAEFNSDQNIQLVNNNLIVQNYQGKLAINIFDMSGRLLSAIHAKSASNMFSKALDITAGELYFITVEGHNFTKTIKALLR